jgi:hypothetical protein
LARAGHPSRPEQWAEWAAEDLQAATVAKFQHDAEQKQLVELSQAREAAEAEQHRQFLREQAGKLAEVAPRFSRLRPELS